MGRVEADAHFFYIYKEIEMSTKTVKSLIVVMLLAAFAGCATGGATGSASNSSVFPSGATGEAIG